MIESSSGGITARRNVIRNLLTQAVDLLKPGDWPTDLEMDLLRIADRMHQGDVHGHGKERNPDPSPAEIRALAAEIRAENETKGELR